MKYLITGGHGFIGRHLVAKLVGEGHEVVVVDLEGDFPPKFEYEFVEKEEEVTVYCPRWIFATTADATAAVISIGLIGHFVIMFFTSYWGTTTEDMFVYGNLLQGVMLVLLHPKIRPREVIVFWKCCSSMCLLFASVVQKEWRFFSFEIIATCILALHTYAHLIHEHKQLVRYINIEDRSLNDGTV